MSIEMNFSGKNVVVVGGTSGINRGVAEFFAAKGANVAVASRSQDKVDDTVKSLKALGAQAYGFSADVRNQEDIASGLKEVEERWGTIDILVSGAAGNFPAFAKDMSANAFKSVIDIDLIGTFHVMQAAYPHLTKPGASIINISAPQAFLPMLAQAHVCSAKAGVDMITRCLAMEWGPEGLRVNSIVPGPIDGTEGMKRLAPTPELTEATRESVPTRRLGLPDDIANACGFLASPQSSYVNGIVMPVDGGWHLSGASGISNLLGEMLSKMKGA